MDSNKKWKDVSFPPSLDGKSPSSQSQEIVQAGDSGTKPNSKHIKRSSDGISESIADIIKQRKELAFRVTPIYQHLSQLRNQVSELNQRRKQLALTIDDVDVDRKLEDIKFDFLEKETERNIEEIERLIKRLSRDTLNVGVLGRMGQGKSTFLKSLSGLDIIPARKGGACTAVRSKFLHHNGDLEATVKFHSEETFLAEVIGEYYRVLDLNPSPKSLDDFANKSLPNPSNKSSTTHQEMYNRLRDDYHVNFRSYEPLVKNDSPRERTERSKDEIQKYVSQERDPQTKRLINFDHLAVREVEIRCRFPKVEVYGLGLIDVPGLGDTKIGDEKVILETLREEVDVVLLVRKPDVDRYQWDDDFQLYELADDALDNLSKRCFIVLNHRNYGGEDNLTACRDLKENTQSIKVVGSPVIADCSNSSEANEVLDLVLEYLSEHIVGIEEQYARSCQNNLLKLYSTINAELEKAQNVLMSYVGGSRQFESSFKEIIASLSEGLNHMLNELWNNYEATDDEFKAVVDAAIQQCEDDKGIPTEDEIEKLIHLPENKNDYRIVYLTCAAELRSNLSKNFLTLDQGLQDASDKLKCLIAYTLISRGGLGELANALNARDVDFLEAMRKMLNVRQNRLELGFKTLLDFKMSYGALIMESIRKDLGEIFGGVRASSRPKTSSESVVKAGAEIIGEVASSASKIKSGVPEIDKVQPVLEVVGSAASTIVSHLEVNDKTSVRRQLDNLHRQAVDKCKGTLEDWEKAPSRLRFYMAEEFVDRILYDKDIEEEWRHFLGDDDIRAKVWIEFKQIEDRKQVQADWLSAVKRVREFNQRKLLVFS
jgi:hypothetical protein